MRIGTMKCGGGRHIWRERPGCRGTTILARGRSPKGCTMRLAITTTCSHILSSRCGKVRTWWKRKGPTRSSTRSIRCGSVTTIRPSPIQNAFSSNTSPSATNITRAIAACANRGLIFRFVLDLMVRRLTIMRHLSQQFAVQDRNGPGENQQMVGGPADRRTMASTGRETKQDHAHVALEPPARSVL